MGVELTDVESVRQFMQQSVSNKLQDPDLETLIDQASGAIQRYCNREFAPASALLTRSFEFMPVSSGMDLIDLTPYEYRVVEEVIVDPDLEKPIVLPAAQYRPWPLPAIDGTYFGLRIVGLETPVLPQTVQTTQPYPFVTRRVNVKARWGMLEVPEEIRHWANVTVESWAHLRRDGGIPVGQDFGENTVQRGYDLPPAVFFGLKRWVRPTPSV
jgi:hypothetical protein